MQILLPLLQGAFEGIGGAHLAHGPLGHLETAHQFFQILGGITGVEKGYFAGKKVQLVAYAKGVVVVPEKALCPAEKIQFLPYQGFLGGGVCAAFRGRPVQFLQPENGT